MKNPDEAKNIMSITTKTDKKLILDIWSIFIMFNQTLINTLENEIQLTQENKLLSRMPCLAIQASFIQAIRLEA